MTEPPNYGRPTGFGDLSPFTLERTEYIGVSRTPVCCLPVTLGGKLLGFLWGSISVDEDAAGFRPVHGAGAVGFDAGGPWRGRLKRARDKGVAPADAVRRWIGEPEDPRAGGVPADAVERMLPDSDAVLTLAAQSPRWATPDSRPGG
ncbi:hypothetical protein [Kribbella speibonae]|uniref:GAF domain-containing protein n=1 Tax=Kribbella speibonae TaxID=1572660 RepID=A0ABY1ZVJ3_9ACTN|nr:hypothetical protein [Kribbella speibonae]TCC18312.1 hypothetical protein E0H58_36550 [Kribbella speibonae]